MSPNNCQTLFPKYLIKFVSNKFKLKFFKLQYAGMKGVDHWMEAFYKNDSRIRYLVFKYYWVTQLIEDDQFAFELSKTFSEGLFIAPIFQAFLTKISTVLRSSVWCTHFLSSTGENIPASCSRPSRRCSPTFFTRRGSRWASKTFLWPKMLITRGDWSCKKQELSVRIDNSFFFRSI